MPGSAGIGRPFREGLWFQDLEVGQVVWSRGRTVTEADVVLFAGLSGDWSGLHVDEELARESVFGRRVAHGMLVWSIAGGLAVQTGIFDGTIEALTGMEVEYLWPVAPGDTLRLRLEVRSKEDARRRAGRVVFAGRVVNQDARAVVEGELRTLVRLRGSAGNGER